eukprot:gene447-711_t
MNALDHNANSATSGLNVDGMQSLQAAVQAVGRVEDVFWNANGVMASAPVMKLQVPRVAAGDSILEASCIQVQVPGLAAGTKSDLVGLSGEPWQFAVINNGWWVALKAALKRLEH